MFKKGDKVVSKGTYKVPKGTKGVVLTNQALAVEWEVNINGHSQTSYYDFTGAKPYQ